MARMVGSIRPHALVRQPDGHRICRRLCFAGIALTERLARTPFVHLWSAPGGGAPGERRGYRKAVGEKRLHPDAGLRLWQLLLPQIPSQFLNDDRYVTGEPAAPESQEDR